MKKYYNPKNKFPSTKKPNSWKHDLNCPAADEIPTEECTCGARDRRIEDERLFLLTGED